MVVLIEGGAYRSYHTSTSESLHIVCLKWRMPTMKRNLILAIVMLVITLGLPMLVFADAGPHGGGYTATTDACAGCHRAHTAQAPDLLMDTTQALCLTCHGSTAAGAQTNVIDGVYARYRNTAGNFVNKTTTGSEGTVGAPLNGGGFAYYRVQGQSTFVATTSTHSSDGSQRGAWGLGSANTGQTSNLSFGLTCGSCHDPHGSTNYRIIRKTVNGSAVNVTSLEGGTWNYTAENWGSGMTEFCTTCHTNYLATSSGSGSTGFTGGSPSVTHFRHRVNMPYNFEGNINPETGWNGFSLPLANTGQPGGNQVSCTTCHLPHGTSAAQGTNSSIANIAGDSSLLRLDNRGVCEVCHQK